MQYVLESAALMAGRPYEVVAQFWHPNEAGPFLSALANEGIEAELIDDNFSMMRTGLEFISGGTKVVVAREDAPRAREIFQGDPSGGSTGVVHEFCEADLTRARIGRECPACGSKELSSPHRPALMGTIVLTLATAAFTVSVPGPGWLPVALAALMTPVYFAVLYRLMPAWRCNACQVRWEMPGK